MTGDDKMKWKNWIYIGITIFLIFVINVYIAQKSGGERNKRFFIQFDTTNINGIINEVGIRYHGSYFKVIGIKNDFVFFPNTGKLNEFKIFDQFAKKGDTVIKYSYSDTLMLLKNGKQYLYTFEK